MKHYAIVAILCCCVITSIAQKTYVDIVADSTCKCLEAGKSKVKSTADFDKLGENCFGLSTGPYLDSFAKDENIPVEDLTEDIGEKIGHKLGMKLAATCPVFIELFTAYGNEQNEDPNSGTLTGTVTAVNISDHVYLTIRESAGVEIKVMWLRYFSGADAFRSNPAALKGKKVKIDWQETEIYHVTKKDFITVKMISQLVLR